MNSIIGVIYYETPKQGCCGLMKTEVEFPLHPDSTIDDFLEESKSMIVDYESGEEDGHRILFKKNKEIVLEIKKENDKWVRMDHGIESKRSSDYLEIFK